MVGKSAIVGAAHNRTERHDALAIDPSNNRSAGRAKAFREDKAAAKAAKKG